MDSRVALQPAYVLHTQPFQNTSLLVDFFTPDVGFEKLIEPEQANAARVYSGYHIVALRDFDLSDTDVAKTAKRLLRSALAAHLGGKPLHSRSLFSK